MVNIADTDPTPHTVVSDQDLYCLLKECNIIKIWIKC